MVVASDSAGFAESLSGSPGFLVPGKGSVDSGKPVYVSQVSASRVVCLGKTADEGAGSVGLNLCLPGSAVASCGSRASVHLGF